MYPSAKRRQFAVSPFDVIWGTQREMDRLFGTLSKSGHAVPDLAVEVLEGDDELRFMIEVPGMRPEDIELTVEDDVLTVSGEKRRQTEEGTSDSDYRLRERRYGRFARAFTLPHKVNTGAIEASYDQGVLTVLLPKAEDAKPRRIEVSSGMVRPVESD